MLKFLNECNPFLSIFICLATVLFMLVFPYLALFFQVNFWISSASLLLYVITMCILVGVAIVIFILWLSLRLRHDDILGKVLNVIMIVVALFLVIAISIWLADGIAPFIFSLLLLWFLAIGIFNAKFLLFE